MHGLRPALPCCANVTPAIQNAGRDVIEVLTKSAPVLDFGDGWQETNNYTG
jgi:hypothetical protein